jgi:hypothetical protein
VKQSTHEIGIRMAFGASGPCVVRGSVERGLRLGRKKLKDLARVWPPSF